MTHTIFLSRCAGCIIAFGFSCAPAAAAGDEVLDLFLGSWEMDVNISKPKPARTSYTETCRRILDGKFIRGETSRKADGSRDMYIGTFDEQADGYPFWIFSSTGTYSYLAPASWDARKRVMHWKSPSQFDISYDSRCEFPRTGFRSCYLIVKDWKGKVLTEMSWTATRRGT